MPTIFNKKTPLNEISKEKAERYAKRAVSDAGMANFARRSTEGVRGKEKEHEYWARAEKNRKKGLVRAFKKIDEMKVMLSNMPKREKKVQTGWTVEYRMLNDKDTLTYTVKNAPNAETAKRYFSVRHDMDFITIVDVRPVRKKKRGKKIAVNEDHFSKGETVYHRNTTEPGIVAFSVGTGDKELYKVNFEKSGPAYCKPSELANGKVLAYEKRQKWLRRTDESTEVLTEARRRKDDPNNLNWIVEWKVVDGKPNVYKSSIQADNAEDAKKLFALRYAKDSIKIVSVRKAGKKEKVDESFVPLEIIHGINRSKKAKTKKEKPVKKYDLTGHGEDYLDMDDEDQQAYREARRKAARNESAEPLDEISRDLALRYFEKADPIARRENVRNSQGGTSNWGQKRQKGVAKVRKRFGITTDEVMKKRGLKKESFESLNEISKKSIGNYLYHAQKQKKSITSKLNRDLEKPTEDQLPEKEYQKLVDKENRREAGISLAKKRMKKESFEPLIETISLDYYPKVFNQPSGLIDIDFEKRNLEEFFGPSYYNKWLILHELNDGRTVPILITNGRLTTYKLFEVYARQFIREYLSEDFKKKKQEELKNKDKKEKKDPEGGDDSEESEEDRLNKLEKRVGKLEKGKSENDSEESDDDGDKDSKENPFKKKKKESDKDIDNDDDDGDDDAPVDKKKKPKFGEKEEDGDEEDEESDFEETKGKKGKEVKGKSGKDDDGDSGDDGSPSSDGDGNGDGDETGEEDESDEKLGSADVGEEEEPQITGKANNKIIINPSLKELDKNKREK